ncbi:MAG: PAS domain S-box protein [Syntrophorhabdaceae bacterium]|nr:PAS domain S-box protein [Syntrophorhabdaceae bacterium]
MKDSAGTNQELMEEISSLKERIRELERSEGMRRGAEGSLQWKTALLEAQMNTSIDGILVIDENQKRLVINQRILEMWDVPHHILDDENDEALLQYVVGLVRYPEQFLGKVNYLYDHPYETSRDEIEFKNGMFLDRYSAPVLGEDGYHYGRIWTFRDITERRRTEEALRESERKFRVLAEKSVAGIYVLQQDGTVRYVNARCAEIFGYTVEEAVDKLNVHDVIFSEDLSLVSTSIGRRISGELLSHHYEFRIITRGGDIRHVEAYSSFTVYEGKPAIIGTLLDITERKRAEEKLLASEERFRTFFNLPIVGFAITGADSRWIHFNDRLCEMLGYSRDELERKTWMQITPPEDLARERPLFEDVVRGRSNVTGIEKRYVRKDGSLADVFVSTQVVRNPDASIAYFASIIQDVTAQKRAEEEIIREREKLRTLSDNAPFGMVLTDKDGHFTYVNAKFTELFGYDLSDIPDGRTWFRKAYPEAEYRHTVISTWVEDFKDAGRVERKPRVFTVTCRDGIKKIIEFIPSRLASGDYLMTCENITELRKLESQLRQAQKMESIGTLAGGIAHDFNNILTTLIGYASLIQTKLDSDSSLRSYVDRVLLASKKGADLTQSLLTFSRQQPVTLLPMDVNDAIRTTQPLLKRLLTENIDLRTSLTRYDTVVMADKSQMDQILFNLVTNARDAMPEGGTLTVETDIADMDSRFIEAHGFGGPGRYVLINVSDTGEGMDEATREKIFDPFFTTKETGKGTGLGLATVYGIVKQHNGYVTVYSEPGHGTAFRIYLPAAITKVREEPDTAVPVGGKETILIAEDDEGVRRIMREALEEYGYRSIEAVDGEDAIDKFKLHREVDLIILDSIMPRKNGREAFEAILRIDPHVRVLFTSGYTRDVVLDKGIKDKEFDFIAKPLSLGKLLQKVREILDR